MVRSAIDGAVLPDTRCDGVCRLQRVCICRVRICGVLLVLDGRFGQGEIRMPVAQLRGDRKTLTASACACACAQCDGGRIVSCSCRVADWPVDCVVTWGAGLAMLAGLLKFNVVGQVE